MVRSDPRSGYRLFTALVAMIGLLGGCDRGDSREDELVVLAASSLIEAMMDIELAYEAANPGIDVIVSHAGSQVLAAQLLEGARADVFASADRSQMERVGELVEEPVVFARNRLVLIYSGLLRIEGAPPIVDDALGFPEKLVIAAESVPAGRYAREALEAMGLWEKAKMRVVSYEADVRGVQAKVVMGEADAGVVYSTDAAAAPEGSLTVVEFPPDSARAEYFIASCGGSERGESFVAFVWSDVGRAILQARGFDAP